MIIILWSSPSLPPAEHWKWDFREIKYDFALLALCRSHPILYRGRILGRNPDKSLKSFPPCKSQSPLQLCLEISISSNSRNLFTISRVQLKSIKKPQVWGNSRLCPETSTKLYVHELGFCSPLYIEKQKMWPFLRKWKCPNGCRMQILRNIFCTWDVSVRVRLPSKHYKLYWNVVKTIDFPLISKKIRWKSCNSWKKLEGRELLHTLLKDEKRKFF